VEGEGRPRLVGVEVEEGVALAADEVVAAGGAAAGYADGLGVGQGRFQGFVVDGCYSVGTETDAEEDEGRLNVAGLICRDGAERVFVHV